jgi:drug/metabolite transporter (DMT)-like permease
MPVVFEFVLLAALWGASFLLMKIGATEFGAFGASFVRVALAFLLLLPLLHHKRQVKDLRANAKHILFVGALNSGIPFALFGFAVLHISTGLASILNATTPLMGAAIAWLWLKDKPTSLRVLGLLIGFVGVAALSWNKASFQLGSMAGWAVLATLTATLCYGIAASYTKKFLQGVPPMASSAGSQLGAGLVLAIPALLHLPTQMPSWKAWAAILVLAFFCTALAYTLYFRIIERAGPQKAVAVTFLIPVFGVSYGAVLMNETITATMLVCGAIIVLGTALATGVIKFGKNKG